MRLPIAVVAGAVVALYAPFLAKPFHLDDPMFLWAARHIQQHPLDFYGFAVNWYGTTKPMAEVMKNPPLAAYWIALVAAAAGWSEAALHAAFLVPALGMAAGTVLLARELDAPPLEAGLVAALTPAFLVSSTTVMCDVLMMCVFVWAVLLWVRGIRTGRAALFASSAALMTAAALTKYFAASLVPLCLGYGIVARRRVGAWAAWLLLPMSALAGYQAWTRALYGRGLLLDAASYATRIGGAGGSGPAARTFVALAFVGGACATLLTYAARLWSRRALAAGAALAALAAWALALAGHLGPYPMADGGGARWALAVQVAVYAVAGASLFGLIAADLRRGVEEGSLLLAAWVGGTLAFAAVINWSVNVRSILPLVPAAGILAARQIADRERRSGPAPAWAKLLSAVLGAAVAMAVAQADARQAEASRRAVEQIAVGLRGAPARVWFQGHWGFQHYAQEAGWTPLAARESAVEPGDAVVVPMNNTNVFRLPARALTLERVVDEPASPWLATMNSALGAGFYSDGWGPLPFAIGEVPPERFLVLRAIAPFTPG